MKITWAVAATFTLSALAWLASARGAPAQAPAFPPGAEWVGPPQSWQSLRGRIVLLDVWTFG